MKVLEDLSIVIVAGGVGNRTGMDVPKQFVKIHQHEILAHTIFALSDEQRAARYIVVCHPDYLGKETEYRKLFPELNVKFVEGGSTRSESCQRGVQECPARGVIFVHDAARPFVNADLMDRLYRTTLEQGSAVPAVPVASSLRKINGGRSQIVDRAEYRLVQTPQAFLAADLKAAYAKMKKDYSDDASLMEDQGHTIHLIPGLDPNFKITTAQDLEVAKCMLDARQI